MKTLADLQPGDVAVIKDLHFNDEIWIKRLHGLGLRKGKEIRVIRKGLTGSPLHVVIQTTELAIRATDAKSISIY